MSLKFGTGGVPLTAKSRDTVDGVNRIKELGLDAMELEFVYQVFLSEVDAARLKEKAKELKVDLSVHGSYYINLASKEVQKWHASITRIVQAAVIGDKAGARFITFHPAFRQGRTGGAVYKLVKDGIKKVLAEFEKKKLKIRLTPELTGKKSQWGDLKELIALAKDFEKENVGFCLDFAHNHARSDGAYNSKKEFDEVFTLIRKELGVDFLENMHIHISGINYSEKGERNHLTLLDSLTEYEEQGIKIQGIEKFYKELEEKNRLDPSDLKWKELMESLKENKVEGIVVCESPNLEQDALLMKRYYESL